MPQDYRPTAPPQGAIGFRELRQAWEISTLKEELERSRRDAGTLRRAVDETVERVRLRFSALTPDEMSDPEAMLPLLQFAVTQLIAVRDRARELDLGEEIDDEGRFGPPPLVESPPEPSIVRTVPPSSPPAPAAPPLQDPPPPARSPAQPAVSPLASAPRPRPPSAAVDWLAPKSNR